MTEPLVLTVYPLDPSFPAGYKLPRDTRITYRAANKAAREKRFTDAELAAESWRAEADWRNAYRYAPIPGTGTWSPSIYAADDRNNTMRRFATKPDYDQEEP
ncbi:hypothetical protein ACQCSX_04340 [Pseudarthrobacter sp. P1]|uniref:hypothetical protein n=1 Tax=Pseudarthrobacter sp. P1 TaxID=3418418 RepID=UPI003CF4AB55